MNNLAICRRPGPATRLLGTILAGALGLGLACGPKADPRLAVDRPRADQLYAAGNWQGAAEVYEQCHAAAPKDGTLLARLVDCYLRRAEETGRREPLADALTRANDFARLAPEKAEAHLLLARVFFLLGADPLGVEHLARAAVGRGAPGAEELARRMRAQGRCDFQRVRSRSDASQETVYYRPSATVRAPQVAGHKLYGIATSGGHFMHAYILTAAQSDPGRRELLLVAPEAVDLVHVWHGLKADPDPAVVDEVCGGLDGVAATYRRGLEYVAARDASPVAQIERAAGEFDRVLGLRPVHYGALVQSTVCHDYLSGATRGDTARKHFNSALSAARMLRLADPANPLGSRTPGLLFYREKCFAHAADPLRSAAAATSGDAEVKGALEWLVMAAQDKPRKEASGTVGQLTYVLYSFPPRPANLPAQVTTHIFEMVFSQGDAYRFTVALNPRTDLRGGAGCFMEKTEPGEPLVSLGAFAGSPPATEEFVTRVLKALDAQEKASPSKPKVPPAR